MPSTADSLIAFNTGMTSSRVFRRRPGPGSRRSPRARCSRSAPTTRVYAGTCGGDNPNPLDLDPPPAPLAIASVLLPPGGSEAATVQLPALHLTVYQGSTTSSARAPGATIKARDTLCSNFLRTFTTNTQGQLDDPGLPYSDYAVCAHGLVGGVNRRRTQNVSMNDPPDVTGGQTLNVFLTGGTSQSGTCP